MAEPNPDRSLSSVPSLDEDQGEAERASDSTSDSAEEFLARVARGAEGSGEASEVPASEDLGWAAPRFEIRRRLGAGGFGVVYEAFDRKRNAHVALKRSLRGGQEQRQQFKREFRALTDLHHPNLVQLYELHGDDAAWFFTMELVRGQDARSSVRTEVDFDEGRLRSTFRQLAEGLHFLHATGRLHRDIKPSNVMVDCEGRVVLLDFGLAVDLAGDGDRDLGTAGTPPYMAPEQGRPGPIGAAADWYAMGVMLYEALTGLRPFEGSPAQIRDAKLTEQPPAPTDRARGVPSDLNRLCIDLLSRSPSQRPLGGEVLERLAGGSAPIRPPAERSRRGSDFVGRLRELERLHEALDTARGGRAAVALVHAGSGMGKTALVGRFLEELRAREASLVVLGGRCFEQESMPDKTLDGIIDALGRHLSGMPAAEIEAVLPRYAAALSRVFPALGQVLALRAPSPRAETADKIELRRRATSALRELLARLGERALLVLFIDDLQWGDAEGGALLADLLRPPDAPSMLVVGAYRSEEAERSECLRALLPALRSKDDPPIDYREIGLGRLSDDEAHALALSALGDRASALSEPVARIARESDGSPFFLLELCRFSASAAISAHPSLSAMLSARVEALPTEARRLLDVIALSGQPIERAVASKASELGDDEPSIVGLLRARSLVRVRSGGHHDEIETYHDRIRETVLARLAPDARRGCHRRLAEALSTTSGADPEMLATHFQGAGDAGRAAGYWEEAASRALDALGFERAARLYRQAIASIGEEGEDGARKRALYERLGVALGHCGRGPEAAVAYLAAAEGAPAEPRLTMRRLAAEHYLMSGHLDEGLAVFRTVLGGTGLSIPWTSGGALARALALVALLRFKGLGFRARPLDQIPADVLSRLDAWSAAGSSMSHFDPSRAPYYHLRSLHLALESGDPYRLLRELVMDLCYRAAVRGGAPPTRFEVKIEALVGELLESLRGSGPRFQAAGGLVEAGRGIVLALRLECRAAREHLEHAEAELSACPLRLGNHITVARIWLVQVLYMLGELKELARRYAVFLADARARGDRFAEVQLSAFGYLLELMADRPEGARSAIDRMHGLWPRANPLARLGRLAPLVMTALYQGAGTGDAARLVLMTEWQRSSTWLAARLSKNLRVFLLLQHGAAHLAAAVDAAESRRPGLLQKVDRDARALARQGTRFACAAALGLRAGAAAGRGDRIAAGALVAEAETCFAEVDMAHYANAARRRRGELLGGDEGRDLIASADAAMGAQGVSNPARMTAALLPGRW